MNFCKIEGEEDGLAKGRLEIGGWKSARHLLGTKRRAFNRGWPLKEGDTKPWNNSSKSKRKIVGRLCSCFIFESLLHHAAILVQRIIRFYFEGLREMIRFEIHRK